MAREGGRERQSRFVWLARCVTSSSRLLGGRAGDSLFVYDLSGAQEVPFSVLREKNKKKGKGVSRCLCRKAFPHSCRSELDQELTSSEVLDKGVYILSRDL